MFKAKKTSPLPQPVNRAPQVPQQQAPKRQTLFDDD